MVNYELWLILKYLPEAFRNIKLILVGDFEQIPPIEKDQRNSAVVKKLSDLNLYTLTKNMRSDDKVYKKLTF